jgi:Mg2+ and Co2+ transporter CorA
METQGKIPILSNYLERFETIKTLNGGFKVFYTSNTEDWANELPLIVDIPSFLLRMLLALKKNQKICIYADYDTDAVTACATAYWGLQDLGYNKNNITFYTPDRFTEGYGINLEAIKKLSLKNDLIISVDCGINSTQEAEYLQNTKTDLIITDHHILTGQIPECVSVINPRLNEYYPQNKQQKDKLNKKTKDLFNQLLPSLSDKEKQVISDTIITIEQREKQLLDNQEKNFLPQSITGVGVAWFALVWLGYFLSEIEEN